MSDNNHAPGFLDVGRRLLRTGFGALQNRAELFSVELQEEKSRLLEVLFWSLVSLFLAVVGIVTLTGTIIFLFREDLRIYAAAGFGFLYLIGAIAALFGVKSLLTNGSVPFSETLDQLRKDRECLDSLK
jgi:uncharacterized membrane protein YqjE